MFPIAPHFYLICFAQSYPLSSYIVEPKGMHSIFQQNLLFFWGGSKFSIVFLVMDQSKWLIAQKRKKEKESLTWRAPLI
jgi:hypothetical protein